MKKKVLLALGAFVVAATIGALGASADSPAPDVIAPTVVHAPGVGSFSGDVRHLPQGNKVPRHEDAQPNGKAPDDALHGHAVSDTALQTGGATSSAPTTGDDFVGLDHTGWGAGWPPDPNGDVGPTYYVQTVNTSVGIFDKASF